MDLRASVSHGDGRCLGPFANPNHFAHLLALGVGPLVWMLQRAIHAHRETRRASGGWPSLRGGSHGLVTLVVRRRFVPGAVSRLMTFSRSGVAMMFLAAAVTAGMMYPCRPVGPPGAARPGIMFLLIGVCLAFHAYQRDSERLGDFAGGPLEKAPQRRGASQT